MLSRTMKMVALCVGTVWADSLFALAPSHEPNLIELSLLDTTSGKGEFIANYPSRQHDGSSLALAFNGVAKQVLLATHEEVLAVDAKTGKPVGNVSQQDGYIRQLGFNANTSAVYGIRENQNGQIDLVGIDFAKKTMTSLVKVNITGYVSGAYYCWPEDHFSVVIEAQQSDEQYLVFIDTAGLVVHKQSLVEAGLHISSFAINFATNNVYAIAESNATGSYQVGFDIVHMSGQLQQELRAIHLEPFPQFGSSVVNNAANMFYTLMRQTHSDEHPLLTTFDITKNGTYTGVPLEFAPFALTLASLQ